MPYAGYRFTSYRELRIPQNFAITIHYLNCQLAKTAWGSQGKRENRVNFTCDVPDEHLEA